jgi:hypothetical protein
MDSEWINSLAAQTRKSREEHAKRNDLRLLDARLIDAKAPAFWRRIVSELTAYVKAFNAAFPDDLQRHIKIEVQDADFSVSLKNSDYPFFQVLCHLNVPAQQFEIRNIDFWHKDIAGMQTPHPLIVLPDGTLDLRGDSLDAVIKGHIFLTLAAGAEGHGAAAS